MDWGFARMEGSERRDGILAVERRGVGGATSDLSDQGVGSGGRIGGSRVAVFEDDARASNWRER